MTDMAESFARVLWFARRCGWSSVSALRLAETTYVLVNERTPVALPLILSMTERWS
jgi:hypothetical protein